MSPRSDRRRSGAGAKRPATPADLAARAAKARATGAGRAAEDRARRMVAAYLQTAASHDLASRSRWAADISSRRAASRWCSWLSRARGPTALRV